MKRLSIIGRVERISLPDFGLTGIPAKVDTGADSSSLWASGIKKTARGLEFYLFGPQSKYYNEEKVTVPPSRYTITRVASSFGQKELRYKVKLRVLVHGRVIHATITLANRSNKTYPMLLGRRMLHNKFVVDVAKGSPLKAIEREKKQRLEKILKTVSEK